MNGATLTQTLVVLQPYLADMPFQLGARVTGRLIQEEMQAVLFGNAKATPEEVPVRIKNMVAGFRFWDNDILTLADKPRVNPGKPSLQQAFAELLERQADGEEIAGDQEDAQFAELVQKQRALERRPSDPTREEDPADKSTFQPDLEATFVHVFKKTLTAVFESDTLTSLLNNVAEQKYLENLQMWIGEFLAEANVQAAETWMSATAMGQELTEIFEGHLRFCRAVAFLFQVPVAGSTPSMDDVLWFADYVGPHVWRKTIRVLLRAPEPAGPNFTEVKKKSRSLLQTLYADAVKTAATAGPAQQHLQALHSKLQAAPRVLEHRCCRALAELMKDLEELELKLRQGGSQQTRALAVEFTLEVVDA
ncbi:HIS7, partial [Symbiodinium pilosum]